MDEEAFRGIIGRAESASGLHAELAKLPDDQLLSFERLHARCMHRASTWDLWGAAHVINGGCSDDPNQPHHLAVALDHGQFIGTDRLPATAHAPVQRDTRYELGDVRGSRQNQRVIDGFMDRLSPGLLYHEDPEADGVVIRDDQARPVARLALTAGGEVSAAAGRWVIAAERDRRGWMVVARDVESEQPVGCAYPRGLLSSFDLWIAPEREYALRERPLASVWTLHGDLGEIARFTSEPRTIRLAESPVPDPELQLVVLLAYEAIRYSEGIPSAGPPSGGG